ncbi:MAG: porphobilinogen synthase, partial [Omnitrophica bacterium]|nr:porphobilinogen synthase [Candidatus Omnitrophota bacterium]
MPVAELNRLKRNKVVRNLLSQTELTPANIILPYFAVEGENIKKPIKSMPGIYHLSVDNLVKDIALAQTAGIKSILLFGLPEIKDSTGSRAYGKNGIVQKAVCAVKNKYPDLIVITDVCLCAYTSHGHCGILKKPAVCAIDNQATLAVLSKIA